MTTRAIACTDIGRRRRRNEDRFAIDEGRGLYVVADGMGGHAAGCVAAEIGVSTFLDTTGAEAAGLTGLREGVSRANRAIRDRAIRDERLCGMGTTLSALWLHPAPEAHAPGGARRALWVHVGDSRIYLLREGVLHRLTRDHSLVAELLRAGDITPEEARKHERKHVITRALGVAPEVEPDLGCARLEAGDRLLLCTDGICGCAEDEEILGLLCAPRGIEEAGARLLELADGHGGEDNATAVIVELD